MAPVVTVIYVAIVLALVVGRYRWPWVLLVGFIGAETVGWPFDSGRFDSTAILGLGLDLLLLLLLFSKAMRRRLRRPVGASMLAHLRGQA
jgi:drug/metabolite transporter (DMT)-like permease